MSPIVVNQQNRQVMNIWVQHKIDKFIRKQKNAEAEAKNILIKKFKSRLHAIIKTYLNARITIKAIYSYAISLLIYSFGIINQTQTKFKILQRIINTRVTLDRKHHPIACVQRLTFPRLEGGRGLIDLQNFENELITIFKFFKVLIHTQVRKIPGYRTGGASSSPATFKFLYVF